MQLIIPNETPVIEIAKFAAQLGCEVKYVSNEKIEFRKAQEPDSNVKVFPRKPSLKDLRNVPTTDGAA